MYSQGLTTYLAGLDDCSCNGTCSSYQSSNGLGFVIPNDGSVDPNVYNQADGSLFSYGSVENLAPIIPASFASTNTQYTGESVVDASAQSAGLVAAPFTGGLSIAGASVAQSIEHMFHFGAGRKEANIITPNQNVIWQYIVNLSRAAGVSDDPVLLQQAVLNLQQLSNNWLRFLSDPRFIDGRASAQAANTIMPYLDGTCGYQPHNLIPSQGSAGSDPVTGKPGSPCMPAGCNGCENAWPGDWGYGAGLLGALRKRVVDNAGTIPPPNDVTQGVGVPNLQFPTTAGYTNLPPQSGYLYNGGTYGYGNSVPPGLGLGMNSSSLGLVVAMAVGALLLSRGSST